MKNQILNIRNCECRSQGIERKMMNSTDWIYQTIFLCGMCEGKRAKEGEEISVRPQQECVNFSFCRDCILGFYEVNSASGKTDLIFLLGDVQKDLNLFLNGKQQA